MEKYLQVIYALLLVIILFIIGFFIYNSEFIKNMRLKNTIKEEVKIFEGIKDFSIAKNQEYNTSNPLSLSYRKISQSYNQTGGIEFTYNFWLYVDNSLYDNSSKQNNIIEPDAGYTYDNIDSQTILFMKGTKQLSKYKNICDKDKKDILVKCPLVKLEDYGKNITVEFNTLQGPEAIKENTKNVCNEQTSNWTVANIHKLTARNINRQEFNKKWIMVTVILQDTTYVDPVPTRYKVRCKMYVNGLKELDKYVDGKLFSNVTTFDTSNNYSVLKVNKGNLYIAPTISITNDQNYKKDIKLPDSDKKLMMADLTYFNYAITEEEINGMFSESVSKKMAADPGEDGDVNKLVSNDELSSKSDEKMLIS